VKNPFHPSFGIEPRVLVGREQILRDFAYGLENGPGDPNRSTVLVGPRGTGKTVVLREFQRVALEHGWIPVYVVQGPRLLEQILTGVRKHAAEHLPVPPRSRVTGVTIGQVAVSREFPDSEPESFESAFTQLAQALTDKGVGLLVEIDETQGGSEPLRRFASLFQTLKADGLMVALAVAGLPHQLDRVFQDRVMSFLRRSRIKEVSFLDYSEVFSLFRRTFALTKHTIDDDACSWLAEESGGFPYLVQLLGYETWEKTTDGHVSRAVAEQGIQVARTYTASSIIELILQDLSPTDMEFLQAMGPDKLETKVSDIKKRTGWDANKTSQYRQRLLREGVITAPSHGVVKLTIPYMREYLRQSL
jgi:type II secretory pathway predicted ATPase ExeA